MKLSGIIYRGYSVVRNGNSYMIQKEGKTAYYNGAIVNICRVSDMFEVIDKGFIRFCEWR